MSGSKDQCTSCFVVPFDLEILENLTPAPLQPSTLAPSLPPRPRTSCRLPLRGRICPKMCAFVGASFARTKRIQRGRSVAAAQARLAPRAASSPLGPPCREGSCSRAPASSAGATSTVPGGRCPRSCPTPNRGATQLTASHTTLPARLPAAWTATRPRGERKRI